MFVIFHVSGSVFSIYSFPFLWIGCKVLLYPGAFNMTTGPVHWELLQRGRALDNQVYHNLKIFLYFSNIFEPVVLFYNG